MENKEFCFGNVYQQDFEEVVPGKKKLNCVAGEESCKLV